MNCYYSSTIVDFVEEDSNKIYGLMNRNNELFDAGLTTQQSWESEITILKNQLRGFEGDIIFEYTIPRICKRIDVVLIIEGIIFLLEFKTNDNQHRKSTDDQVMDYALDLKNFHKESKGKYIVPMSVATDAEDYSNDIFLYEDKIFQVLRVNKSTINKEINLILEKYKDHNINSDEWINSEYSPTPTIIESARYMYANHNVKDISRSDAAAENLTATTDLINEIIYECKKRKKKAICFITGVPGAGKTLAGLNIATQNGTLNTKSNAVFLSGNGPLVKVLQEALARDLKERNMVKMSDARRKTITFINNIHKFRDNYIRNSHVPFENIVIFDEAQRCWTKSQLIKFMAQKKNIPNYDMSEPECLLEIMDRHNDWCVVICLVGGGQEINTGEAGIEAWIEAIKSKFNDWQLFISNKMSHKQYIGNSNLDDLIRGLNYHYKEDLHLSVSLRSFRSENLAAFVQYILDEMPDKAKEIYGGMTEYPIKITRDIEKAKQWLRKQKRGTERIGILASSNALRLRPHGIWVQDSAKVEHWFLSDDSHIESSNALEKICTEFDIQGLEIDYGLVAWDGDFRIEEGAWKYYGFRGDKWTNINVIEKKKYKMNAYRVLLTRARQGMVIFVPKGVDESIDRTRNHNVYDETYNYLLRCGIESID